MKKTIGVLTVLLILSCLLPAARDRVFVLVDQANVRAEPNTDAPVIARLEKDRELPLLALSGNWCQVLLPDGQRGFIHRHLVAVLQAEGEPQQPAAKAIKAGRPALRAERGRAFRLSLFALYHQPAEAVFRQVYGGKTVFAGEAALRLWHDLSLWVKVEHFSKRGRTTGLLEDTELSMTPVMAGLQFELPFNDLLRPYLGLGLGWISFSESNPIGSVEDGGLGYQLLAGARFRPLGPLVLEGRAAYSICRVEPAGVRANLGGFKLGLGLGLEF